MTIDLTGGLDVSREFGFEEYPTTPGMRDAVNFWFCDEQGRFGMPRARQQIRPLTPPSRARRPLRTSRCDN
jgi:hypothetical protein